MFVKYTRFSILSGFTFVRSRHFFFVIGGPALQLYDWHDGRWNGRAVLVLKVVETCSIKLAWRHARELLPIFVIDKGGGEKRINMPILTLILKLNVLVLGGTYLKTQHFHVCQNVQQAVVVLQHPLLIKFLALGAGICHLQQFFLLLWNSTLALNWIRVLHEPK